MRGLKLHLVLTGSHQDHDIASVFGEDESGIRDVTRGHTVTTRITPQARTCIFSTSLCSVDFSHRRHTSHTPHTHTDGRTDDCGILPVLLLYPPPQPTETHHRHPHLTHAHTPHTHAHSFRRTVRAPCPISLLRRLLITDTQTSHTLIPHTRTHTSHTRTLLQNGRFYLLAPSSCCVASPQRTRTPLTHTHTSRTRTHTLHTRMYAHLTHTHTPSDGWFRLPPRPAATSPPHDAGRNAQRRRGR